MSGEVRIVRAAAHHVELPWSAGTDIRVGGDHLVVHVRAASARELADRLHDHLRDRAQRLAHRAQEDHRAATPPPWRGGPEQ